jgi:multidrug efflux pump
MILSDLSVRRPVLASVISLLLIVFGLVAFSLLPLREYPDIDPPVVTVETLYPGASATVVETQITEIIEEQIAGVEGIRFISSKSEDGQSSVTIEFNTGRDVDGAANDIRDRVSAILGDLPQEAQPPEIQKVDSNEDVIMWLNLVSTQMTVPELTDYANRYLEDKFSVLNGVARVRIGGGQSYAMRVWLDRKAMAARGLTVSDIENTLRSENLELPAGSIESQKRNFTVRVKREFRTADDFKRIVLARGSDGYLVRLGDVARVERGTEENRTFFRGNGEAMVGIGIIKQSTANTIDVARSAKAQMQRLNPNLPQGMQIKQSYDTSVFIEGAIREVYKTLLIAIGLVVLVIYLFLGSFRATLVPAATVPVSIIASFIVLYALGFTVNLLTLLALVLAIGLVVDDAIVVLENIYRRIAEKNESPLVAAFRGSRQVGFAVIATSLVLIAVFVPIAFIQGDVGRLFSEFALTMAAAVCFSSIVALSLSPMMASKLLKPSSIHRSSPKIKVIERIFVKTRKNYRYMLNRSMKRPLIVIFTFILILSASVWLFGRIPTEYAPREDRGAFFVIVNGPEGASYAYMEEYMDEIERRLMPLVESGEATRLLVRAPRTFANYESFNTGLVIFVLNDWSQRRSAWAIMADVRASLSGLPGVRAFPVMRSGFGGSIQKPLQFVIGGGTYEELARWRDILLEKIAENNPGLEGIDWDYKETTPQLQVDIDYDRSAELGVTIETIGRTLETMLGSRRVTTYIDAGEEYDVILEGERDSQRTPTDLQNIYVRSSRSGQLIPLSNLVTLEEFADSKTLNRYNRVRAITIEANLSDDLSLGDALAYMENLVKTHLPGNVIIDYKGNRRILKIRPAPSFSCSYWACWWSFWCWPLSLKATSIRLSSC